MSDKQTVIQDYRAAYSEFRMAVEGLTDEAMTKPFLDQWSVREVLGHIAGWHDKLTVGLQRVAQGQRPTPEGEDWSDIQGMNAGFAQGVTARRASDRIQQLDTKANEFVSALEALPDDRFGENKTLNRMAAGAGYHHFREHASQIKEARQTGKL